jgi:hypothetical protein
MGRAIDCQMDALTEGYLFRGREISIGDIRAIHAKRV